MVKTKQKKNKVILIVAITLIAAFVIGIATYFVINPPYNYQFDGKGTKKEPYLISSKSDLITFMGMSEKTRSDHKGKYFKLTTDIDLEDTEWIPVCYRGREFGGSFDGGGKTISNFSIKAEGDNVGFFAYTKNSFVDSGIFNLRLEGVTLSSSRTINNVGVLVGSSMSKIENCYVDAIIDIGGTPAHVGGIVGYSEAAIINSESHGMMNICAVERVASGAKSMFHWPNIGGIAGSSADIRDAANYMQINMTRVEASGSIDRSHHVGGIVGGAYGQTYYNLKNYADINAVGALGGIIGTINKSNAKVEKCFNYGDLFSTSDVLLDVGGVVGRSFQDSRPEIKNCYNEGNITMISLLRANAQGSQTFFSAWAGGIIALGRVNIANCVTVGNVVVTGDVIHYVGGIAGGLNGMLKNSYNMGNVSVLSEKGSVIAGGIIGVLQDENGSGIVSCYNAGSIVISLGDSEIPANYLVGGVMGYNMRENNSIQNNYYDVDVINSFHVADGFGGPQFWYGEETSGGAENVSSPTIMGNVGVPTSVFQTAGLTGFKSYVENSNDVDAVWIFETGKYPRLFWQE